MLSVTIYCLVVRKWKALYPPKPEIFDPHLMGPVKEIGEWLKGLPLNLFVKI